MQGLSLTWVRNHLSLRDPEKPDMLELKQPSEQQPWASFLTMRGFTCIYVDNVAHLSSWKWKSLSHVQLFATLWTIQSMEFSRPEYWSLLQGIFSSQGSNPGLLHCRQILYQVSHKRRPRISEWVAYPFSADLPDPGIELGSSVL